MSKKTKNALFSFNGSSSSLDGKLNLNAMSLIMALRSEVRCEFAIEAYSIVKELVLMDVLRYLETSPATHTVRIAGRPMGVELTGKGTFLTDELLKVLQEAKMLGMSEYKPRQKRRRKTSPRVIMYER